MSISYNKLFKLLIDKGIKKTDLAKIAGLNTNTLAKLSRNEYISMESQIKICKALDCQISDFIEVIRD